MLNISDQEIIVFLFFLFMLCLTFWYVVNYIKNHFGSIQKNELDKFQRKHGKRRVDQRKSILLDSPVYADPTQVDEQGNMLVAIYYRVINDNDPSKKRCYVEIGKEIQGDRVVTFADVKFQQGA